MNESSIMNVSKKTELPWVNYIKAICLFFIYFHHCEFYTGWHNNMLDAFYAPFFVNSFFVISGYLLFKKQLSEPIVLESIQEYAIGGG